MISATFQNKANTKPFNKASLSPDQFQMISENYLADIRQILWQSYFFHGLFLFFGIVELFFLLFFFKILSQIFLLTVGISIFFFTILAYFILKVYVQFNKEEKLVLLKEKYLGECKDLIHYKEGFSESHLAMANISSKIAAKLNEKDIFPISIPLWLSKFNLEKLFSYFFLRDLYSIKELLLFGSVEEHTKLIRSEPVNLEAHAHLANSYVMLSSLYSNAKKQLYKEEFSTKFRKAAERAMEEFKILKDFAPHDPWVHSQLAYSYHDLNMPEEEINEYETLLKLQPDDRETLFKLGLLYFQQGWHAKGLRVYQELKKINYPKVDLLLSYY